jgi:undecaprenyl-diphosphatase
MTKLLAMAVWPAGLLVILCAGSLIARKTALTSEHADSRWGPPRFLTGGGGRGSTTTRAQVVQYVLLWAGAAVLLYAVMVALGELVVHAGPTIDKPFFAWSIHHQSHSWFSLMKYATQVGYKWTAWGSMVTAAVLLTFIWQRHRWLPAVAIVSMILSEHFLTIALNHTFHRPGPPGSGGTFPSGGTDRAFAFYGLIAYLLWREVSRRRTGAVICTTIVAALGFNEAYSRLYLAVHWLTDVVSGTIWGCLLAITFITIVRVLAGPPGAPEDAALPVRLPDWSRNRPEVPA